VFSSSERPGVFPGRYTARAEGSFVVFLIGLRVNRLRAVGQWWPVARAMPPMLESLRRHPESGFLGAETCLFWRGVVMLQYWRSFEDLDRFARSPSEPHLAAWRRFNRAVGADGSVGIFHETYLVADGQYECVYGNMPRFGLARAFEHVPAVGNRETARLRLNREEPGAPVAAY
jgi:Monooxygenase af470-like